NVKKFLSENKFDIVHSHMDLLNGITLHLAKKAGIKKRICHGHNSKSQYKPEGALAKIKMIAQKLYYKVMKRSMINASTDLLACSDLAGEYFFDSKNYTLIYNGVQLDRFIAPSDFNKKEYSKTFGLDGNENHIIVTVGRVSMQKNPLFALEVISELKKLRDDFKYVWVGVGGLEEEMREKIKMLSLEDTVIMAGLHTDIPQILNCCDCFLMTSIFEGLPFTLVEAQAAGLRCIVSDVVTKNADAGLLEYISLEKSAAEWAEFINKEIDKPIPRADERLKLFDIKNTVKQLEGIYDK
ncbi:MAG: glycosyltransferase, partial [Ruminococcus sp.]|nr:glycosyltransferase [Candidatus Copronaster equi]